MPYSIAVGTPSLGKAPEDAASKPHHVKASSGRTTHFKNPHPSAKKGFSHWSMPYIMIKGQIDGSLRLPSPKPDEKLVPVQAPTFLPARVPAPAPAPAPALRTTWLGHASHYTEFPSGLRVLFDPVLEDRCSPFAFAGPKRYTRRACAIADLPFVDAVVISHSHYDHLSVATVRELRARFPAAHFFVGLGLAGWFRDAGVANVTEMDWWEDAEVTVTVDDDDDDGDGDEAGDSEGGGDGARTISATISCLPSQHTSSRYSLDTDRTLWCSWAVTSPSPSSPPSSSSSSAAPTKSIYFGGDTGYRAVPAVGPSEDDWGPAYAHLPTNPDFAHIGALRGPFDVGLLPIGAYKPRALFAWMHADPVDAVEILRDTRCKRALGIHWGTWALTTEPVMEPPAKLRAALARRGMPETGVFDVCDIGESRSF